MKGKVKQTNGITLITLVITIVLLIILSTVTINVVFGEGGLLEQAGIIKEETSNMVISGEESMGKLLQEYANVMAEDEEIANPNENDIVNPDQNEIIDPGTDPEEPDTPTLPEGWDGDKVTAVESADGEIVPVPTGYVASNATGENTVIGGFVIYEGDDEVTDSNVDAAKTTRNQFVWVPVDDINDMANLTSGSDTAGRLNYEGKLYSFTSSGASEMGSYGQGTSSNREPDIVTDYDNTTSYMNRLGLASGNAFKEQLQLEFNEMVESVNVYGGFYIGRYETGNLESSLDYEPVVMKENSDISDVDWYYMYGNSKLIAANDNVKTTMIWGSMWDRTLIWLAETYEESNGTNGKSYAEIVNSSGWGNYNTSSGGAGEKQPTGNSETWKANNIYDMAGNVYDRTIEADSSDFRILRGGYYNGAGSSHPASNRLTNNGYSYPSRSSTSVGCRSALYITP